MSVILKPSKIIDKYFKKKIIKSYQNRLLKSKIIKNTSILASGTLIHHLLIFGSFPLLSRLLTPKDFGIFGIYTASLAIIGSFSSGKFENAIMLPKIEIIAKKTALLGLFTCLITSFFILIATVILFNINKTFSFFNFELIFFLIPFHSFTQKYYTIIEFVLNRQKKFKELSQNKIIIGIVTVITTLFLTQTPLRSLSLIIGIFVAHMTSSLHLTMHCNLITPHLLKNKKKFMYCLKRFKKFPLLMGTGGLINRLASDSPIYFLSLFYGVTNVGYYTFAIKIVENPLGLLSKSMADAFRQEATEKYHKNNCFNFFKKTLVLLASLISIPCLLILIFGQTGFTLIFGNEWKISGKIAQILSIACIFRYGIMPICSNIIQIAEKLWFTFSYQVILAIGSSASILISHLLFKDFILTLSLFLLFYCIMYIYEFIFTVKILKRKECYEKK
tara:strand:- start:6058 stop:7395 length:1338 start_codon:yes stop_codon:yes gene_type:complete